MSEPESAWRRRVEPARIEATVRALRAAGELSDEAPAVIVHDLELMRARVEELRASFPASALHAVAIKANPVLAILRELVTLGLGLEAASWGEVELALAAGCAPERIVYDSPAKTRSELRRALELGLRLNLDNLDELERVAALGPGPGAAVGLRINPAVGSGSIAATSVADRGSRFGVPWPGSVEPLVEPFVAHPWLSGLHVHVGSQGCPLEQLLAAAERVLELREAIDRRVGEPRIRWIDIGGGLPTDYGLAPMEASLFEYVAALRERVPRLLADDLQVVTELGRALQVGCGFAISRVEYVKRVGEHRLATIHLGADLLLRTAYAPGDWPHELRVLDPEGRAKAGAAEPWTVLGPLCFAGDVVARDRMLPPIEEGDLVVVRDTGGYTTSMWSRYCSRTMPAVAGLRGAAPRLEVLRPREDGADIVHFWRGREPGTAAG